jgi:hypothetical protein
VKELVAAPAEKGLELHLLERDYNFLRQVQSRSQTRSNEFSWHGLLLKVKCIPVYGPIYFQTTNPVEKFPDFFNNFY